MSNGAQSTAASNFNKHAVLSVAHEMTQVEAAVTGAPGGVVFNRQQIKDYPYAELRALQNTVTGAPAFTKWIEYDPQARLNALSAATMSWNASPPSPVPLNPYSRAAITTNPPGVRAP